MNTVVRGDDPDKPYLNVWAISIRRIQLTETDPSINMAAALMLWVMLARNRLQKSTASCCILTQGSTYDTQAHQALLSFPLGGFKQVRGPN